MNKLSDILTSKNFEEFNIDKYEELSVELAKINMHNIDDELCHHPTYYAYYNGILSRAKRVVKDHTIALEVMNAEYKAGQREIKKQTVEALKDLAQSNPVIIEAEKELAKFEEIYDLVRSICMTLEHKKDMLVQLSANKRKEAGLYQ